MNNVCIWLGCLGQEKFKKNAKNLCFWGQAEGSFPFIFGTSKPRLGGCGPKASRRSQKAITPKTLRRKCPPRRGRCWLSSDAPEVTLPSPHSPLWLPCGCPALARPAAAAEEDEAEAPSSPPIAAQPALVRPSPLPPFAVGLLSGIGPRRRAVDNFGCALIGTGCQAEFGILKHRCVAAKSQRATTQ